MHSELMAAVPRRADVLPGFVLAAPPFVAAAEIEEALNLRHELRYFDARTRRRPEAFDAALGESAKVVEARSFPAYGRSFLRAVFGDKSLTPVLVRACLVRHHPCVTTYQTRALLAESDDAFHRVREACLDLFDIGPTRRRRGQQSNGPARDGINLNDFTLALLKHPGVTWADVQAMTLTQAILLLCGDTSAEDVHTEARMDAQIKHLTKLATKHGLTLADFGRMGAPKLAVFIKEHSGKDAPLEQLYPLLKEPEFA